MGSVRFLSNFSLMIQWKKVWSTEKVLLEQFDTLTLDAGFLEPALDAGFTEALDAGLADTFDAGLTLDTGLEAALDVGLEAGLSAAFDAGFACRMNNDE